jgi:hypothetical protein
MRPYGSGQCRVDNYRILRIAIGYIVLGLALFNEAETYAVPSPLICTSVLRTSCVDVCYSTFPDQLSRRAAGPKRELP